ncbi:uncharacterized protein MELLADRAFT_106231 [Melampsora larici-populina 98AG31]|uniref:Uncharacterized protein n=1 Tax=Melampsora larici-populina (strain 98AG31 / pathotype 3-4-7) TaxID=747676 RepID=F4RLH0_MELLP|nr:uncharacterized protein MELLADRAFT_106231 [Melampsora larici-populina 98AG31]EGG06767.1 hypothetical protein MELLADRAFT_106231 [Melampsora larici-populina 98AG31]
MTEATTAQILQSYLFTCYQNFTSTTHVLAFSSLAVQWVILVLLLFLHTFPDICFPIEPTEAMRSIAPKQSTPHNLIDDWKSTSFIASIPATVRSACESLKDDGSNFPDWEFRIVSLIETITGLKGYFDVDGTVCTDLRGDQIIRYMIQHSISTQIARKVTKSAESSSAKSFMMAIKSRFSIPNLSAIVQEFNHLHLTSDYDATPSPPSSESGDCSVSWRGFYTTTQTAASNITQHQNHRSVQTCLYLVDIDGKLFTAEEAILGEVQD